MIIKQDSREQYPLDFSFYSTEVEVGKLDTGDYTIKGMEDLVCVERKRSTGELALNIGKDRKRFFSELDRMQDFKYRYFLFEFSVADVMQFPINSSIPKYLMSKLRINRPYLVKCIEDFQFEYNIEIIYAKNATMAAQVIHELFEKLYAENHSARGS